MKTAILIGATGLVGSHVLDRLMSDRRFEQVIILVRRPTGRSSAKLQEHVVDFAQPSAWQEHLKGDVLFSCLGTTLKKAGSKEAQYTVDYTYQYEVARLAAAHGVPDYVLVSSPYASPDSAFFYTRIKGELERAVQKLPFEHIHILQPGILAGKRSEKRLGESIGNGLMSVLGYLPGLKAYRPIHGDLVARAMIQAVFQPALTWQVYSPGEIFQLAAAALPAPAQTETQPFVQQK